jgi:hypothetical protein
LVCAEKISNFYLPKHLLTTKTTLMQYILSNKTIRQTCCLLLTFFLFQHVHAQMPIPREDTVKPVPVPVPAPTPAPAPNPVGMTTTYGPTVGSCGAVVWGVSFQLSAPAASKGYIIQKITFSRSVTPCTPANAATTTTSQTYYEAWAVDSGATTATPIWPQGNDGFNTGSASPGTKGSCCITGEVKFFPGVTLPPSWIFNNPNTLADSLASDTLAPPFWNNSGATPHTMCVTWDCCNGKDTTTVTTNPLVLTPVVCTPVQVNQLKSIPMTVRMIQMIPSWTIDYSASDQEAFRAQIKVLKQYSETEIAEAVHWIETNYDSRCVEEYTDHMTRIFLMMRALYDVPEQVPRNLARNYGCWVREGARDSKDQFDLQWPLRNVNGELTVVGKFAGSNCLHYNASGELRYISSYFPRRSKTDAPTLNEAKDLSPDKPLPE